MTFVIQGGSADVSESSKCQNYENDHQHFQNHQNHQNHDICNQRWLNWVLCSQDDIKSKSLKASKL